MDSFPDGDDGVDDGSAVDKNRRRRWPLIGSGPSTPSLDAELLGMQSSAASPVSPRMACTSDVVQGLNMLGPTLANISAQVDDLASRFSTMKAATNRKADADQVPTLQRFEHLEAAVSDVLASDKDRGARIQDMEKHRGILFSKMDVHARNIEGLRVAVDELEKLCSESAFELLEINLIRDRVEQLQASVANEIKAQGSDFETRLAECVRRQEFGEVLPRLAHLEKQCEELSVQRSEDLESQLEQVSVRRLEQLEGQLQDVKDKGLKQLESQLHEVKVERLDKLEKQLQQMSVQVSEQLESRSQDTSAHRLEQVEALLQDVSVHRLEQLEIRLRVVERNCHNTANQLDGCFADTSKTHTQLVREMEAIKGNLQALSDRSVDVDETIKQSASIQDQCCQDIKTLRGELAHISGQLGGLDERLPAGRAELDERDSALRQRLESVETGLRASTSKHDELHASLYAALEEHRKETSKAGEIQMLSEEAMQLEASKRAHMEARLVETQQLAARCDKFDAMLQRKLSVEEYSLKRGHDIKEMLRIEAGLRGSLSEAEASAEKAADVMAQLSAALNGDVKEMEPRLRRLEGLFQTLEESSVARLDSKDMRYCLLQLQCACANVEAALAGKVSKEELELTFMAESAQRERLETAMRAKLHGMSLLLEDLQVKRVEDAAHSQQLEAAIRAKLQGMMTMLDSLDARLQDHNDSAQTHPSE